MALRQYHVQIFLFSRYKELSVKTRGYMKETKELIQYFPDYSQSELPERNYLWTVISFVIPKETKSFIERAREQRGVSKNNMSGPITLTYDLKKEIFDVKTQKSKYSFSVTFQQPEEMHYICSNSLQYWRKRRKSHKHFPQISKLSK